MNSRVFSDVKPKEESPDPGAEKLDGKTEEEKKKETELEKYWRAVKENSMDFTGWTYLLQYVEQEVRALKYKLYNN